MATVRLTDLLPTNGYLLTYALSLFFASLLLTIAGAFLTLDRTRSFAPASDVLHGRNQSTSRLIASFFRGGVGGILIGFVFGMHLTTFLSVLIPSVTLSQPLKPASYLSTWLLSSLVTSIAAGKWKYFALVVSGFCGGGSLALAVSVTIHPSLLTRIVLVTVLASLLAVLTPLPIARLQPILLRTSSSAAGSFGLVVSFALLSRIEPWSNVWERLWVHDDIQWGSAQEKGLSAGFFLFLASGVSTDWWLKSKFGENPDQKWDSYLAQYATNLPAESNRAGIFHPFASIWSQPPFKHPGLEPITPSEASQEKYISYLCKGTGDKWMGDGHISKTKTRGNVKFRPLNDDDSTDSETEPGDISGGDTRCVKLHPWLAGAGFVTSTHSPTRTVLDDDIHPHRVCDRDPCCANSVIGLSTGLEGSDLPNYSDHEVDITSDFKNPHFTSPLDEIVSGARRFIPSQNPRDSSERHGSPRWQAFWRDVDEKIQHKNL